MQSTILINYKQSHLKQTITNFKIPKVVEGDETDADRESESRAETIALPENLPQITQVLTSLNNLAYLTPAQCPIKDSSRDASNLDPSIQFLANSTTRGCLCNQLYSLISGQVLICILRDEYLIFL